MNKEKLDKAACHIADYYSTDVHAMGIFKDGVEWAMNLPLGDRLTDAEEAYIKSIYAEAQGWLNEMRGSSNFTLRAIAACIQDRLELIFGKELFKEVGK